MELPRRHFLAACLASLTCSARDGRAEGANGETLPTAKFLDVDGIRTRYFEGGQGPNLVLIHGGRIGSNSYSANVWGLNFGFLSRHFRVYAFDKLGMGYTDNPRRDADYSKRAQIRHAAAFIRRLGIRRTTLLGHSMGALVAARIAIEQPDLVEKLILLDSKTLAPDDPSVAEDFYTRLRERGVPEQPTMEYVRREPEANSYSNHHLSEAYLQSILKIASLPKRVAVKEKAESLRKQFLADLGRVKVETLEAIQAGQLKAPTLIIWGFNDVSAPLILGHHLMRVIAPAVPQTRFVVVNQAGHYLFREKPQEFNRIVADFILDG